MTQATAELIPDTDTIILRPAQWADLDRILVLHEAGVAVLPPGSIRHDKPAFFECLIADGGCVVADLDGLVVGYGGFVRRDPGRSTLAAAIGAGGVAVAHVESSAVDRLRQGTGLHRRLIDWRLNRIRAMGFECILASVSPLNPASLSNLLRCGFVVRAYAELYGGLGRFVMEHRHATPSNAYGIGASVTIPCSDEARCRELLDNGWFAAAGVRRDNHLDLVFGK